MTWIKSIDLGKLSEGKIQWLIVGFVIYVLYKILTNDLTHLNATLDKFIDIEAEQTQAMQKQTRAIESLETAILRAKL